MSEKIYDDLIAGKLREVGELCKEHKLPFMAICEYEPESIGATYGWIELDGTLSLHMLLPVLASCAKGNVDSFLIELMKYCNKHGISMDQSMFLHKYGKERV